MNGTAKASAIVTVRSGLRDKLKYGSGVMYPNTENRMRIPSATKVFAMRSGMISFPNSKLTHGSLAGGSKSERGEGAEAAEAASVTEPVEL